MEEALQQRTFWSCRDFIKNGDEEGIDCGGSFCEPCGSTATINFTLDEVSTFPNPSRNTLNILSNIGLIESIELISILGHKILEITDVETEQYQLDLSLIEESVFIVRIKSNDRIFVRKHFNN